MSLSGTASGIDLAGAGPSAARPLTLSQQRAEAVVAKLGELGVAPGVLTAKGYGQDKPVADNATDEGRASNRRIEFTVVK